MQDWQLKIQINSYILLAEIEAMKAANTERLFLGNPLAYGERAFMDKSLELTRLAENLKSKNVYFMRLLVTSANNRKIIVYSNIFMQQKFGKQHDLSSCINEGRKKFKKVHCINPAIIGYAVYSGPKNNPSLEYSYVIEEYEHLKLDITEV